MVTLCCLGLPAAARAQDAPAAPGCSGPPKTWQVVVDSDENGKLFYREGENDARTIRVCPADDITWTGGGDDDELTISFAKPGNDESPADDGQMQTSHQHRIHKHIKRQHRKTQYSYTVTLSRGSMEYVDDPLIIIGH
ncbi:MAG TPA: hypothetical protein VFA04_03585 [Bryobacteraceae bacterium]|nr:hypothetical protein [Bryobacteraceae bacterium]